MTSPRQRSEHRSDLSKRAIRLAAFPLVSVPSVPSCLNLQEQTEETEPDQEFRAGIQHPRSHDRIRRFC